MAKVFSENKASEKQHTTVITTNLFYKVAESLAVLFIPRNTKLKALGRNRSKWEKEN